MYWLALLPADEIGMEVVDERVRADSEVQECVADAGAAIGAHKSAQQGTVVDTQQGGSYVAIMKTTTSPNS